jgi:hypothetical protein
LRPAGGRDARLTSHVKRSGSPQPSKLTSARSIPDAFLGLSATATGPDDGIERGLLLSTSLAGNLSRPCYKPAFEQESFRADPGLVCCTEEDSDVGLASFWRRDLLGGKPAVFRRTALKNSSASGTVACRPSFVTIGCRRTHCSRAVFRSALSANAGHIAVNGDALARIAG